MPKKTKTTVADVDTTIEQVLPDGFVPPQPPHVIRFHVKTEHVIFDVPAEAVLGRIGPLVDRLLPAIEGKLPAIQGPSKRLTALPSEGETPSPTTTTVTVPAAS